MLPFGMLMRNVFTGTVELCERESIIRDLGDAFRSEWEVVDRITINNNREVFVVTAEIPEVRRAVASHSECSRMRLTVKQLRPIVSNSVARTEISKRIIAFPLFIFPLPKTEIKIFLA
jgi:hypothetical protein